MPFYTLRPGHACGHHGRELALGEVIELPVHVGREVSEKLMPCKADGTPLVGLSPAELVVEQGAPHERESLRAEIPQVVEVAVETPVAAPTQPMATPKVRTVPVAPVSQDKK